MLYRKISGKIEQYLKSNSNKMLVIDGARQVGKSFIIRHVGKKMFTNFIEINMELDKQKNRIFEKVFSVEDFLLALSSVAGNKMQSKENTLIFIDEIQAYDHLLTLVKFLMEDGRFTYIASGSQLGIALRKTQSIPLGSLQIERMFPLDFEEFIIANGVGDALIENMRDKFFNRVSLDDAIHDKMMDLFRKYLLVGGMPDAVNTFLSEHNLVSVRKIHYDIRKLYKQDAAKYEESFGKKLLIQRIYDLIPSNLENKKKRVVVKNIEGQKGKRMDNYREEFEYLISSGIALDVLAVSNPIYPLSESSTKNLLKLYINDVGILTSMLYRNNLLPIMQDECSVNLGSVYENVVAQELKAHGFHLHYYDNKKRGEIDYLVDDADTTSILPIEVKSGKDYWIHRALDGFINASDYDIHQGIVFSNEKNVFEKNGVTYFPIYYSMFLCPCRNDMADYIEI